MKRFNPTSIVKKHFKTLHKEGKDKLNLSEVALFSVIPLALAAIISVFYLLDEGTAKILVTVFAVFAGLFLNLLAMIYNVFDRSFQRNNIYDNFGEDRKEKLFLFEEMIHNIAFGVLISIMMVILSLAFVLFAKENPILLDILNFLIHFFLIVFIFTVLMVLKRLDNLIASEMRRKLIMFEDAKKEGKKTRKQTKK
ncbi:MAG: hypothetical protein COV36_07780 [Alphaproteobacteria bacterium CG11_big_fil_rev_8_21_14_0_20_44_7]|nr:MAG: hypothetical protein COV36_07780 [Alphaproteobacteria bacterium CG11_big_fil_rev_8_21_14_0_20_44_7]